MVRYEELRGGQISKANKCNEKRLEYIPFYVKQGFDKYEKTIKNYFIDNYEEEAYIEQ